MNVVDYVSVSTTVFDLFRFSTIAARVNDCLNGGSVFRRALLSSGSDQSARLITVGCLERVFANRIPVMPCQQ